MKIQDRMDFPVIEACELVQTAPLSKLIYQTHPVNLAVYLNCKNLLSLPRLPRPPLPCVSIAACSLSVAHAFLILPSVSDSESESSSSREEVGFIPEIQIQSTEVRPENWTCLACARALASTANHKPDGPHFTS